MARVVVTYTDEPEGVQFKIAPQDDKGRPIQFNPDFESHRISALANTVMEAILELDGYNPDATPPSPALANLIDKTKELMEAKGLTVVGAEFIEPASDLSN